MKTYKLDERFEEFINQKKHTVRLREASIKTYEDVWRHFRQQMPEITTTDDLSQKVIAEFFNRLEKRKRIVGRGKVRIGIKDSTVQTYGRRLKCFFDWLVSRGELRESPIKKGDLPTPVYDDNRALSRKDIEKIIMAVKQNSKNTFTRRRDLAMIDVFVYCGLRRGELLGIKVADVDFDKAMLRVDGKTSKSKVTRYVPLHRLVLQGLDEYMAARKERKSKCEYLWVSDVQDERFSVHGLKHWVNRIREWSGVKFHVHQFRHSFACAIAKDRQNVVFVQRLLGHTDLRMTMKYLRGLGVEDDRDIVDRLAIDSFG